MLDYEKREDTLATVDCEELYKLGFKTMACVINSDTYSGRGKHWMALFGDMRGSTWTVEFFNSSGNPPQKEFYNWLVKAHGQLSNINKSVEIVKATSLCHQQSKTECGVYSLYYIWARLNGIPHTFFKFNEIPDIIMFEFRQHLFFDTRSNKMPELSKSKKFNIKEYVKDVQTTWENDVAK